MFLVMRLSLFLSNSLFLLNADAASARKRQSDPVDPGTAADCTYFLKARDTAWGCARFEKEGGISHADFVSWNPAVKDDCSGIKVGNAYCVEVNYGLPRSTSATTMTTTSTTTSSRPPTTTTFLPSPTQDGLTQDCKRFYMAEPGDTCDAIVATYGTFTIDDFLKWNPAVGTDCRLLLAHTFYCVGVSGTPTTRPPHVTTQPPGKSKPSPTQPGLIDSCESFYQAQSGDTCDKIVSDYRTFSFSDFVNWNPAVGGSCARLLSGFYYCVGVPGTPTEPTKPSGPSPTQPGVIDSCQKYYQAASGDTCQGIVDKNDHLTLENLYTWNKALSGDCRGLLSGYFYCIAVPPLFQLKTQYHLHCTGDVHNDVVVYEGSDGMCVNTDCTVGSWEASDIGSCPGNDLQISYWENTGCSGQWYGYTYMSRGTCHSAWTEGYKFRSLHIRCAAQKDDCTSKGTCTYDPEPANRFC